MSTSFDPEQLTLTNCELVYHHHDTHPFVTREVEIKDVKWEVKHSTWPNTINKYFVILLLIEAKAYDEDGALVVRDRSCYRATYDATNFDNLIQVTTDGQIEHFDASALIAMHSICLSTARGQLQSLLATTLLSPYFLPVFSVAQIMKFNEFDVSEITAEWLSPENLEGVSSTEGEEAE